MTSPRFEYKVLRRCLVYHNFPNPSLVDRILKQHLPPPNTTWIWLDDPTNDSEVEKRLNQLGGEGWELVSTHPLDGIIEKQVLVVQTTEYILKRLLPS